MILPQTQNCGDQSQGREAHFFFTVVVQQFVARGETQQSSYPKTEVLPWRATPCNALFDYSAVVWDGHTTGVTPHARARTYVRINVRTSETAFTPLEAEHMYWKALFRLELR